MHIMHIVQQAPEATAAVLNLFLPVAKPYIPNVGFTQLGIPTSQMQFTLVLPQIKTPTYEIDIPRSLSRAPTTTKQP